MLIIALTEHLPCARHCAKLFIRNLKIVAPSERQTMSIPTDEETAASSDSATHTHPLRLVDT